MYIDNMCMEVRPFHVFHEWASNLFTCTTLYSILSYHIISYKYSIRTPPTSGNLPIHLIVHEIIEENGMQVLCSAIHAPSLVNVLGSNCLVFRTSLVSRWLKTRRHGTPAPQQAVKASHNEDAKGKTKELLPCSQLCQQDKRQCMPVITTMCSGSCGPFLRVVLLTTVEVSIWIRVT